MAAKNKDRSRDDALALAIAGGASLSDAAKAAGLSLRTAARRNEDPEFLAKIDVIRAAFLASAVAKVGGVVGEAADKLASLMRESEDDRVQMRSAELLLKLAGVGVKREQEAAPVIVATRPKLFPAEEVG